MTLIEKDSAPATHKERINRKNGRERVSAKHPVIREKNFLEKVSAIKRALSAGDRTYARDRAWIEIESVWVRADRVRVRVSQYGTRSPDARGREKRS